MKKTKKNNANNTQYKISYLLGKLPSRMNQWISATTQNLLVEMGTPDIRQNQLAQLQLETFVNFHSQPNSHSLESSSPPDIVEIENVCTWVSRKKQWNG